MVSEVTDKSGMDDFRHGRAQAIAEQLKLGMTDDEALVAHLETTREMMAALMDMPLYLDERTPVWMVVEAVNNYLDLVDMLQVQNEALKERNLVLEQEIEALEATP